MGGVLLGVAKAELVQAGTEMSRGACPMSLSVCTVPMAFPLSCSGSPNALHDLRPTRQKGCPVSCPLHTQGHVISTRGVEDRKQPAGEVWLQCALLKADVEQHTLTPTFEIQLPEALLLPRHCKCPLGWQDFSN